MATAKNERRPTTFLDVPADSHFPLANLPYGVFRRRRGEGVDGSDTWRVGCAIGDLVLDLAVMEAEGAFGGTSFFGSDRCFDKDSLNSFMSLGQTTWREVRAAITDILDADNPQLRDNKELRQRALVPQADVEMGLPARIGDYTDFFVSKYHAENCGSIFRGAKAVAPNWTHMPVGYHGRASSVVVSGRDVRRPRGQFRGEDGAPVQGPCRKLDFELEMACLMGPGNELGSSICVEDAEQHVFGLVLMNDWSARDVQAWEAQPLGPFNGKNFATTISPWVVTLDALQPFRCPALEQDPAVLPYLQQAEPTSYDIRLQVSIQAPESAPAVVTRTNFRHLYFTLPQMVAHHTFGGCNLQPGDLLGTGTISGDTDASLGSLLELSWNGTRAVDIGCGGSRSFLEDGDTVTFTGFCQGEGFRVGFGDCCGKVIPAPGSQ
mmetsp:Transcript_29357/g.52480  ORF Transcript_29357/g.52480 Transcript_29357/m.52480 type:complete len:435 (-) Transcript_29357:139-1443(-)|eukprot:CAMPEP_0177780620 /NCGR_PEP_ID=MMETSP0491_2-20121128/17328_1 /TAXON_ID=63592 /ORGANISM="Tetraselmis chuii, Strain PLY429" /LENGTH=434 /DNA_ID=CAMNT_0019300459 /DNA_START=199 /DNA_END=1503 /DNA_ORIENTATION=-